MALESRESRSELETLHTGIRQLKSALQREQGEREDMERLAGDRAAAWEAIGRGVRDTVAEEEPGQEEEDGDGDHGERKEEEPWVDVARHVEAVRTEERDRAREKESALQAENAQLRASLRLKEKEQMEERDTFLAERRHLEHAWVGIKSELMLILRAEEAGEEDAAQTLEAVISRYEEERREWMEEKTQLADLWKETKHQLQWYRRAWESEFWKDGASCASQELPPEQVAPGVGAQEGAAQKQQEDELLVSRGNSLSLPQREALIFSSRDIGCKRAPFSASGRVSDGGARKDADWHSDKGANGVAAGVGEEREADEAALDADAQNQIGGVVELRSVIDIWASNRAKTLERMRQLAVQPRDEVSTQTADPGGHVMVKPFCHGTTHVESAGQYGSVTCSERSASDVASEIKNSLVKNVAVAGPSMQEEAQAEAEAPQAEAAVHLEMNLPQAPVRAQSRPSSRLARLVLPDPD